HQEAALLDLSRSLDELNQTVEELSSRTDEQKERADERHAETSEEIDSLTAQTQRFVEFTNSGFAELADASQATAEKLAAELHQGLANINQSLRQLQDRTERGDEPSEDDSLSRKLEAMTQVIAKLNDKIDQIGKSGPSNSGITVDGVVGSGSGSPGTGVAAEGSGMPAELGEPVSGSGTRSEGPGIGAEIPAVLSIENVLEVKQEVLVPQPTVPESSAPPERTISPSVDKGYRVWLHFGATNVEYGTDDTEWDIASDFAWTIGVKTSSFGAYFGFLPTHVTPIIKYGFTKTSIPSENTPFLIGVNYNLLSLNNGMREGRWQPLHAALFLEYCRIGPLSLEKLREVIAKSSSDITIFENRIFWGLQGGFLFVKMSFGGATTQYMDAGPSKNWTRYSITTWHTQFAIDLCFGII
ncbi:MAG: methyl-accepting chemotaxis protein, partial [Nanoarchaeota archaeon]|nr:methyl-accepting chemotaxis protein [Nanoarchaeota archaeon]